MTTLNLIPVALIYLFWVIYVLLVAYAWRKLHK